jgi:hypothetical protein
VHLVERNASASDQVPPCGGRLHVAIESFLGDISFSLAASQAVVDVAEVGAYYRERLLRWVRRDALEVDPLSS